MSTQTSYSGQLNRYPPPNGRADETRNLQLRDRGRASLPGPEPGNEGIGRKSSPLVQALPCGTGITGHTN